jgi:hypothetical protein
VRIALLVVLLASLVLAPAASAAGTQSGAGAVIAVGHDATVDRRVERVVVVGGDLRLGPAARVDGDVIVLFGALQRSPDARVDGSEYVLDRGLIDWIPGPGWVAGVLLVVALLVYRMAVWAAVCAVAATLPRAAVFERWTRGWEPRPALALAVGVVAVVLILPALGLLALSAVGLPLALLGLAALLVACGAGLAMFREGPLWPRRPGRLAYAAYLLLPPALEVGLLITAAGGLGTGIRALTRAASERGAGTG